METTTAIERIPFHNQWNPPLKEVVHYTHSLTSMYCCGHVDKLTLIDGEWFSDTIMRFNL